LLETLLTGAGQDNYYRAACNADAV